MTKRNRRLMLAEALGQDVADVEHYQKGQHAFPLFQVDDGVWAVVFHGELDRFCDYVEREYNNATAAMIFAKGAVKAIRDDGTTFWRRKDAP